MQYGADGIVAYFSIDPGNHSVSAGQYVTIASSSSSSTPKKMGTWR